MKCLFLRVTPTKLKIQIVMTDESNMGDYAAHAGGLLTLMGLDPPLSCTPTDVPMQKVHDSILMIDITGC